VESTYLNSENTSNLCRRNVTYDVSLRKVDRTAGADQGNGFNMKGKSD